MSGLGRLELTWVGKDERPRLEPRILVEDAALSYRAVGRGGHPGILDNVLIHGDNLLALKALEQDYRGAVKCVYIDPPYNTGSAFAQFDDGVEHSLWLSLMRERLEILWRLLREDGSLWVSIDDREMPYLRVLLDEVCGRGSFIATNVWQKRYSRENREAIGDVHEYIVVYARDPLAFKLTRNRVPLSVQGAKIYKNPSRDPKGDWRAVPMTAQGFRPNQMYEITAPGGRVHVPPEGRCWSMVRERFDELLAQGRIYFGRDGNSQPGVIRYLSEVEGVVPWTWWPHDDVGHTDEAQKESQAIFGREHAFGTPKPERLVQRILQIASNPGDLVLDSFAGSGTTGAVAHKLSRRWIMIELGNHCNTHVVPRMRKVIDGDDPGGVTTSTGWGGGGGFRFYRLAPSLLEQDGRGQWVISKRYNPAMLAEAVCKHEGFLFDPSPSVYWQHGRSTEQDFIYVTTQALSREELQRLSFEVGPSRTVLVCCGAFVRPPADVTNLTARKIPKALLDRCEWGRDDYSLNVGGNGAVGGERGSPESEEPDPGAPEDPPSDTASSTPHEEVRSPERSGGRAKRGPRAAPERRRKIRKGGKP